MLEDSLYSLHGLRCVGSVLTGHEPSHVQPASEHRPRPGRGGGGSGAASDAGRARVPAAGFDQGGGSGGAASDAGRARVLALLVIRLDQAGGARTAGGAGATVGFRGDQAH